MTFGHAPAPARLAARRRLAILIPLAVGLVVGAVFWRAGVRDRTAHAPPPGPVVCELPAEPAPPPEPPRPVPSAEAWDGLERCLREHPFGPDARLTVTVADVRRWVEVEGDPVWFHENLWWFPLSGEGGPSMPSGAYVGVPLQATAPCAGAIMN